jgi:ADP-heptose:LPS heptosyltransferase
MVWKVGDWAESRSIPFKYLTPLFNSNQFDFLILQSDPANAGWQEGYGRYAGAFSLYDFAGVIRSLDLLLCVDSMPVHLAGSQNIPVWVMLEHEADWRWMDNREDSPWYPSARLFRQPQQGDWNAVIKNISDDLIELPQKEWRKALL